MFISNSLIGSKGVKFLQVHKQPKGFTCDDSSHTQIEGLIVAIWPDTFSTYNLFEQLTELSSDLPIGAIIVHICIEAFKFLDKHLLPLLQ